MNEQEMRLFCTLRKKVADYIKKMVDAGEPHKSYEGIWEVLVSYPSYFDDETASARPDCCNITLHCYLIGPSRGYTWHGKTVGEALEKCKRDIDKWTNEKYLECYDII